MYGPPRPATEIDNVRATQETYLYASKACYRDSFTLSVDDDRTSQKTHLRSPRPVTGIAL
jgi:hypothetical protein